VVAEVDDEMERGNTANNNDTDRLSNLG